MFETVYTLILTSLLLGTPERPDVDTLLPPQKLVFEQVANEEFCSCDSSLSISGCLDFRKKCPIVNHLADFIYTSSQRGLNSNLILHHLSNDIIGPFCLRKQSIPETDLPAKGNINGSISILEFADFRCSHCKKQAKKIRRIIKDYKKHVKLNQARHL